MKSKYTYVIIITLITIVFNLLILIFPKFTITFTIKGLMLWYNSALPSLLPFIISTNLLKRSYAPILISKLFSPIGRPLFNTGGIGIFPIIMGMLSGYPLGAKITSELYMENKISKKTAEHLILFTNNSGPLFIVGTVGTIFLKNTKTGYFIMLIHYVSAMIIGAITADRRSYSQSAKINTNFNQLSLGQILSETIYDSIRTIVSIGGYIILFSIITGYITQFVNNKFAKAIIYGIFEITGGCSLLSAENQVNTALISALISWGGLSIHFQAADYIIKAKLPFKKYLLSKFFQSLIAFLLCFILYPIYAQKLS